MMRVLLAVLCLALPARAAEEMNYSFRLGNGALVLYQTFSQVRLSNKEKAFGTASASGNIIRRAMLDENHEPWIAFELHIDRKPGPGPIRFLLSMEPMGGWGFFGGKPAPREIENGDRILLDVLEEPGTGRKIYDTFQVGIDVPMQIMPLAHDVPQVPAAGTRLHITNPRFMHGLDVAAKCEGTVHGTLVALSVPEKGRFLFSSGPAPGFRMEAIVDGARLMFVVGNELYDVFTADPIVAPGSWYLWVRREGAPGTASEPTLYLSRN
jgi:hypothetical protein